MIMKGSGGADWIKSKLKYITFEMGMPLFFLLHFYSFFLILFDIQTKPLYFDASSLKVGLWSNSPYKISSFFNSSSTILFTFNLT